jgi:hypothetical protein
VSFTERLALVISARADQALREIQKVRVEATGLKGSVGAAGQAASSMGANLKAGLAAGATVAAAALAKLAQDSIEDASALNEQIAATEQVFGDAAASVLEFGEDAAGALGISNRAALQAAAGFGDFFTGVGVSNKNAAQFSTQLVRLAADLASFKDRDPGEVLQGLTSGLAGETEPLRRLGIFINEAAVKSKAMELGIAGANGEVSEGAKVQARYALILEKSGKAQGDVARTSDSLANRQRQANAELENARARIGQDLLPVAADATSVFAKLVDWGGKLGGALAKGAPGGKEMQVVLGLLTRDSKRQAEAYEQLTAAQAQQSLGSIAAAQTQQQATETLKRHTDVMGDIFDATRKVSDVELDHQDAVRSFDSALADITDAERDLAEARRDRTDSSRDAISAERALNSLEDAESGVVDAEKELARAREGRGRTAREIADAEKAVTEAQRDYNAVAGKGGTDKVRAAERLAEARERLAEVSEDGGRERDVADATEALSRAQLDAKEAALNVAKAKEEQADRERVAAERIATAEQSIADARINARGAAIDLARTEAELAGLQAAAAGKAFGPVEQYNAYRDALIRLKDTTAPGSELRRNLEGVINALPPPAVPMEIIADTAQARAELESLGTLIESIQRSTVNILAGEAAGLTPKPAPDSNGTRVINQGVRVPGGEGGGTTIQITQNINADSDTPLAAVLEQANSTLGWTLSRITQRSR